MADLLPSPSIFVDGWFGGDGQSEPNDGVFTGGWYGGPESIDDISDRLARLEAMLISHKPIFVNDGGQMEEIDVTAYLSP